MYFPGEGMLRMLMVFVLAVVVAVLGMAAFKHDLLGDRSWWMGAVAGLALAWAWTQAAWVRTLVTASGMCLVVAVLASEGAVAADSFRAFAQGMSLGLLVGLASLAWVRWRSLHAKLIAFCSLAGDAAGLAWLARHRPRDGQKG